MYIPLESVWNLLQLSWRVVTDLSANVDRVTTLIAGQLLARPKLERPIGANRLPPPLSHR